MSESKPKKWHIRVDTGGTFTDCIGIDPNGRQHRVKVLSSSGLRGTISRVESGRTLIIEKEWPAPDDFLNGFTFRLLQHNHEPVEVQRFDAGRACIKLTEACADDSWKGQSFEVISPEEAPVLAARLITQTPITRKLPPLDLRLATTRGTNALLERKGAETALFITEGFGDLLRIGDQRRPDLFALEITKPAPLYKEVVEVPGRLDAQGRELKPVHHEHLEDHVKKLLDGGTESVAVVLMNSYVNDEHEQKTKQWLQAMGFTYISVSSGLSGFVKILHRAQTALVNAYLAPVMERYLKAVKQSVEEGRLFVMTSAGGLKTGDDFTPKDSLLSGPAAGVVGAAASGKAAGYDRVISFDMGGTSTDVSRYDNDFEYIFEHEVGQARLMAPAVSVETVAAGGGSICSFDGHALKVGPESAGASPGPACYGAGGPLTITDINLLAGRLDTRNFHIPVEVEVARKKLQALVHSVSEHQQTPATAGEVIEGFLDIANQRMAEAIGKISLQKGYDPAEYAMVAFGGAGGQHCCAIAASLGINTIIIPQDAGLLSAYGLDHALLEHFEEEQLLKNLDDIAAEIPDRVEALGQKAKEKLAKQAPAEAIVVRRKLLFMRLRGQESTLEVNYETGLNLEKAFEEAYRQRYGHGVKDAAIEVESLRVVASTKAGAEKPDSGSVSTSAVWRPIDEKEILCNGRRQNISVYNRNDARSGAGISGPALILDPYSTIWVEAGWEADVDGNGSLVMTNEATANQQAESTRPEAVELELFTHRFTSIAEKMGEMLQRTALSVNVKERHDFSCALLNREGELVVNAPHIPVHLGAMGICVRSVKEQIDMHPGDVIITNHPACGGSHLPDVTVITPVFTDENEHIGYAANRAHHAEIGGTRPGSMPPDATCLAQEGVVISPMYLLERGESRFDDVKKHLLNGSHPTRNITENMTDLQAQVAANRQGAEALRALSAQHGLSRVQYYMTVLKERAAALIHQTLQNIPNGTYESTELLDDGTPLCAKWIINEQSVHIDFEGTGAVHPHNLNATPAIVNSVVMYVLRVLVDRSIPLNEGLMEPVTLNLPRCLLNPAFPNDPAQCPAVVGGNIEISQRLTDTLLKPFERIACGQGTMNNVLFGNDSFGYYETVGGGSGGGPDFDGADGVHQHMTNTKGTDPEILEQCYPVRLDRYAIRNRSGGKGKHNGGDGIVREMTFLEPVKLSVLSQHREQAPYGQQGGQPGQTGSQWVLRKSGEKIVLEPSDGCDLQAGDRFILHTPGGGGFGKKITNNK